MDKQQDKVEWRKEDYFSANKHGYFWAYGGNFALFNGWSYDTYEIDEVMLIKKEDGYFYTMSGGDCSPQYVAKVIEPEPPKANPNSNLTPSELRDKLDAVEVIGVVS